MSGQVLEGKAETGLSTPLLTNQAPQADEAVAEEILFTKTLLASLRTRCSRSQLVPVETVVRLCLTELTLKMECPVGIPLVLD